MLIVKAPGPGSSSALTADDILASEHLAETYAVVMLSPPVLERVIADLKLSMTEKNLEKNISVAAEGETGVLLLKVAGPSARWAENVAGTVLKEAPPQIALSLDSGPITVVSPPKADEKPVYPTPLLNTAAAGLFGSFAGALFAAVRERPGGRLRSKYDVEQRLGLPLLGVIPQAKLIKTVHR